MNELRTCVIAIKAKSDKASLKTLAYQVAQITTLCTENNIKIKDCIITFGGTKDILREVKKLDAQKHFDYLVVYSPYQVAKDMTEFSEFVGVMEQNFKIDVKALR